MAEKVPATKQVYGISEVVCPESCNCPASERGRHFRAGPDCFTCTKCHLKIWRHFMGYELTPTDLQEMLHGDKITSASKALIWKKDGKEISLQARLVLNENYRVRLAPKIKTKRPSGETCPDCKTGELLLITAKDDSQWYGCENFPRCRFTKPFIPHRFNPQPANEPHLAVDTPARPATTASRPMLSTPPPQRARSKAKIPNTNRPPEPIPSRPIAQSSASPRDHQRLPDFILKMLKLPPPKVLKM